MGSTAITYHNPLLNSDNNQIINNSLKQNQIFKINMYQKENLNVNKKRIKEIKKIELIKNDKNKNKYNNNARSINLLKNNLGYKKHINLIKSNEIIKEESDNIDENSGRNAYIGTDNINSNLSEFIINNDKYYHYDYDEKNANHKSALNKNSNSKASNNATNINNDLLSSERTINMTNSDAEYFTDNYSKANNNIKNNNSNNSKNIISNNSRRSSYRKYNQGNNNQYFDKFKIKNNIFNKVRIYKMNDNDKNIKKSKSHSSVHKIRLIKNDKESIKGNNKEKNIKKTNSKNIKKVKSIKQNEQKQYSSTKKIYNSNSNNNVFLESKYLSNSNNTSHCRINKASSYNKINKIYKSNPNEKVNNYIHKNFSFKNISNNIILNQKKIKDINNTKIKKRNINTIGKNQINNYSNSVNQISSNNYSYNYNNFYIYNDDQNFKLNEKRKMTELIEKIPNKELKNEIMTLYQRIINYNNEVIINNRSNSFNYIITFSNNYINMNENKFSRKKFDLSFFLIKREINIQFISMNFNNKFKNEFQENKIYIISNNNENKKENNINNYINNNNIILNDENNDDFFKQYTFKKKENDSNIHNESQNSKKSKDINEQIKQDRNTVSNNSNNNQAENNKLELNNVNKFWNKIINRIEITTNKDKKEKLESNFIHSRKKSIQIMKKNYTLGNEENDDIKKSNSLKTIYTKSYYGDKIQLNKKNKFYSIYFSNEKILFEQSINKIMKLRELLKRIQSSIKNKNKVVKEDALIMFSCICLLSNVYFMIFKDKESMKPLFKKRINLIKQLLVFKRANKFIIIIKFQDVNKNIIVNINNNDIYHRLNEKEENIIGILISKENSYIEFIKVLKLLIPYLEIVILN